MYVHINFVRGVLPRTEYVKVFVKAAGKTSTPGSYISYKAPAPPHTQCKMIKTTLSIPRFIPTRNIFGFRVKYFFGWKYRQDRIIYHTCSNKLYMGTAHK